MKNIRKAKNASYRGRVDIPVKLVLEIFQKKSKKPCLLTHTLQTFTLICIVQYCQH
jgi:hypothetical protein